MIIDSHQHFWKFDPLRDRWITDDMHVLKRDFLPEELHGILTHNGIEGCIAVQADQSEDETSFLLSLAEKHDFIKGVVGWVDLRSSNLVDRLQYFSRFEKLKGFRHIVQAEPKGFLRNKNFIEGVKKLAKYNFSYDLLVYHYQLDDALFFLKQIPEVRVVIDHLAKPAIAKGDIEEWKSAMRSVAALENVSCKISGMVTEANWKIWKPEDMHPYLDVVFEYFTTERLMYGSDWPVCLVAASYERQLDLIRNYLAAFSSAEQNVVLGGNAAAFYRL